MMRPRPRLLLPIVAALGCGGAGMTATPDYHAAAEEFFRVVYACEPPGVDAVAADSVVLSYPIFDSLFGAPALRGRRAVSEFSAHFCSRWSDPQITIYDAVQDGNRVVLVWGFQAVGPASDAASGATAPSVQSWGGISYFRFDDQGRVEAEIGEESTPGPAARVGGTL
jgi:hypothetical protein